MSRHATRGREGPRRAGFTLIEILVVVAVLGLIVAILLPSLSKARQQARGTICKANLKTVMFVQLAYLTDYRTFPPLNNEKDDGYWQYNYLIFDGKDWEKCFGPLVRHRALREQVQLVFCPFQQSPYNQYATSLNPWPVTPTQDTRASYGRRHLLTGRRSTDFRRNIAVFADVIHIPSVVRSAHKDGVNAAYLDGHAAYARDPGIFTKNELIIPFDLLGNGMIDQIWKVIDKKG